MKLPFGRLVKRVAGRKDASLGMPGPAKLVGWLDGVERSHIGGWAARPDGSRVQLRLHVDGKLEAVTEASNFRADLQSLLDGTGQYGFHHRFARPVPEGTEIALTDHLGNHVPGSPRKVPHLETGWMGSAVRWGLSKQYLNGTGIEIGAAANPLPVAPGVNVRYVDQVSKADICRLHPELDGLPLVDPDIVTDGQSLVGIPDSSQDFVIANHMIEHAEDPIALLKTFARVIRPGGTVFMAVPDKRFTFDSHRPLTEPDHLIRDHEEGPEVSRSSHYAEWAKLGGDEGTTTASALEAMKADIHFHVWTPSSFNAFLDSAIPRYGIGLDYEAMLRNHDEFIVILRRAG